MSKQLTIGLFGFGCVGQGLYEVLNQSVRFKADFKKICIKHPDKKRILDSQLFTTNKWELLNDPEINTIVELIDDPSEAYLIITTALKQKKNVVSANKKVIAEHLEELIQLQIENNVSLIYEASACGGIPIIRTLEEYYDNESLKSLSGIFNGSSNFILSKIFNEGLSYSESLKLAQELGFAETDPTLDVEGYDPKYKLIILALHAYGILISPDEIFNAGINFLGKQETSLHENKNIRVKLNPVIKESAPGKLSAYVLPLLINDEHQLTHVNNEYNAVIVEGSFSDAQLFIGKGAGGHPTGAAVLSDISALSYDYKYEYKKYIQQPDLTLDNNVSILLYFSGNKVALLNFFNESEIAENESGCFVLKNKTTQWLIDNKDSLYTTKIFIAGVHEQTELSLKEYYSQILEEVLV